MHKKLILIQYLLVATTLVTCDFQAPLSNSFGTKDEKLKAEKQQKFPPCKSCTVFIESFKKVSEEIDKKSAANNCVIIFRA